MVNEPWANIQNLPKNSKSNLVGFWNLRLVDFVNLAKMEPRPASTSFGAAWPNRLKVVWSAFCNTMMHCNYKLMLLPQDKLEWKSTSDLLFTKQSAFYDDALVRLVLLPKYKFDWKSASDLVFRKQSAFVNSCFETRTIKIGNEHKVIFNRYLPALVEFTIAGNGTRNLGILSTISLKYRIGRTGKSGMLRRTPF